MNDLLPFEHGEEGTHAVCNKHNIGGHSVCCECTGKTDCSDMNVEADLVEDFTNLDPAKLLPIRRKMVPDDPTVVRLPKVFISSGLGEQPFAAPQYL
jgi:hypothetical protein